MSVQSVTETAGTAGFTSARTAPTASQATSAAEKQMTVDYDTFLKLMLEQMKHQDPTSPVDSNEQLAQLASFSQLEQSINTNKNLEQMLVNMSFGQIDDLVGRTATDANGLSGTVTSVEIYSDGTLLGLESGEGILLGPGVKIS